jgi:hypothetical protein
MIPNSLISTKILLNGYTNLRDALNGQCNTLTCPHIQIRYETRFQVQDNWNREMTSYHKKRQNFFVVFVQMLGKLGIVIVFVLAEVTKLHLKMCF